MTDRKDLPPPSAPNFNQRLRETIQTYLGKQGNPLDRGVTLRDLIANGIVKFKDGFNLSNISGSASLPIAPVAVDEVDLTPPPQPAGFVVSAAISHVFIEHDAPIYRQGRGHLRTHVYGVILETGDPLPTFDDAVEVGQFSGQVWAMPSNPSTTWRLWIKWETNDGVLSPTPAGGTNGLEAITGQDVALLLDALTGEITESQLFSDLSDRIDLIDVGPNALVPQVTSINGKYTVKIDNNGYVSGFGLASTANNATPFSDFAVRADRFYIASPSGPGVAPSMPFIVRTTATTIGGVNVPVGVYMNDAFIQNGTITNAKIANLAVDNAKIANLSVDKLTAGSIAVGQHIQSTGYVAGSSGWRINGNGTAEFGAASIRGQLSANQIDTRGLSIRDNAGNIILAAGTPLSVANITGLGSLATQSSVNWNSQIINIPAFGNFAYISSITSSNISTYIAGAAIGTAYIANAAITNALIANSAITSAKIGDAEITGAKIADAAITSAKIGDAQITTAKIGTAQVGTLTIAGNAVTFPVSAFSAATARNTTLNTWQDLQTISITTSGNRVYVAASADPVLGSGTLPGAEDPGRTISPLFRLARDSTELMRSREAAMSFSETPSAGTYTYKIQVISQQAGLFDLYVDFYSGASNRSLFVIETKR